MKDAIRNRARELGFDLCHFTTAAAPTTAGQYARWLEQGNHAGMAWLERGKAKREDPQLILPGARSLVCLAASYATHPTAQGGSEDSKKGIFARYAQHTDYHDILAGPLKQLSADLDAMGGSGTRSLWYVDTGPILERDLAQRAGLGFVGKHTNLISRQLGNWFFIAEILTTLEIPPDEPEHNRCGTCTRCMTACPTDAIPRPFELDARRCISYLTIELKGSIPVELRPLLGRRIYGCDDCLAACPWNRFAKEGSLMLAHRRADLDGPDLVELLNLDDAAFKARFAGTPVLRTKRRGLLRNVCVALGNWGGAEALPHLERASHDAEPLIAEHALWAMGEIRQRLNPTVPEPSAPPSR